jgi:peptidoglycan L-alanyl-D-glutamate endopeptidase CwlK
MDKITLDRIELAHPKIKDELRTQYLECNKMLPKNCRLRFAYVFRSPEEQSSLFKKRPKVTNANAWQSIHNYGLAFDIVLLYDNDGNGTFEEASWSLVKDIDKDKTPEWTEVVNYFKSKGWTWGGDWKSFKDAPHFEKTFGYTWRTLKPLIDSGKVIEVNGLKYPNI